MSRRTPYRLTYRDRLTLRKAVEGSLARALQRPSLRLRLAGLGSSEPSDPDTADTDPAPPPNSDWDTEPPASDPPTDPDLTPEDVYDPASRTVL